MPEEWRPVRGYESRYMVSSLGRVKSLDMELNTIGNGKRLKSGCLLIQEVTRDGYTRVGLSESGRQRKHLVHRLVAMAFLPASNLPEVNHIDRNRKNNAAHNLEWVDRAGNYGHSSNFGANHATTNPNKAHKLTLADVADIRRLRDLGMTQVAIGRIFHINHRTVGRICAYQTWRQPDSCILPRPEDSTYSEWQRAAA